MARLIGRGRWARSLLAISLTITALPVGAQGPTVLQPKTYESIPASLEGGWYISLCIEPSHCWIRYQNEKTGVVHTLGRFEKGSGGRHAADGTILMPKAPESGLMWDHDLFEEPWIAKGKFLLVTVKAVNPTVFTGKDGGKGYQVLTKSCVTFARDAWRYYSSEHYDLSLIPTPTQFADEIGRRHANIPIRERMKRAE